MNGRTSLKKGKYLVGITASEVCGQTKDTGHSISIPTGTPVLLERNKVRLKEVQEGMYRIIGFCEAETVSYGTIQTWCGLNICVYDRPPTRWGYFIWNNLTVLCAIAYISIVLGSMVILCNTPPGWWEWMKWCVAIGAAALVGLVLGCSWRWAVHGMGYEYEQMHVQLLLHYNISEYTALLSYASRYK